MASISLMSQEQLAERRRHPRSDCPHERVIEVADLISGRHLGRLVNVSVEGFLLVGPAPIEANAVLQLTLSTASSEGERRISVGAVCMWNSEAGHPGHYWSGFHMIDIPDGSAAFFASVLDAD
jgi:PilZ domain